MVVLVRSLSVSTMGSKSCPSCKRFYCLWNKFVLFFGSILSLLALKRRVYNITEIGEATTRAALANLSAASFLIRGIKEKKIEFKDRLITPMSWRMP